MVAIPAADAAQDPDPEKGDEGEPEHASLSMRDHDKGGEERA